MKMTEGPEISVRTPFADEWTELEKCYEEAPELNKKALTGIPLLCWFL